MDGLLVEDARELEIIGEQAGLVVEMGAGGIAGDFLQAKHVRVFGLDDVDHPLQPVEPIAAADAFVDVVAEEAHESRGEDRGARGPGVYGLTNRRRL